MPYLRIIRPLNCSITFISVLVGAWIGQDIVYSASIVAAGFIGFVVCAFGNVVNDIADIEIDRINNPARPLPSGKMTKNAAVLVACILFALPVAGAFLLGVWPFLTVITALILLFLYSTYLKKTLAGNLTVALVAGLSFVFGGFVARNPYCVIPLIFSLFIHTPREIVKDVMDMKGDKMIGAHTLPILAGPVTAYNTSALILAFLCLILPLPYILGILNVVYIIFVLAIVYPLLFYIILRLLRRPPASALPLISNLIKISMGVGLAAMIVS